MAKLTFVPFSEELSEFNYLCRLERASKLFNPHQDRTREELLEKNKQDGFDLTQFRNYKVIRHFALIDGEPLGNVSLKSINLQMMTAEIGYLIAEKYYGQGLGTQMVSQFLEQVFRKTLLRRVEAVINEGNIASCRLVEKLGFVNEGLLREHYMLNGKPANNFIYGLLKEEFTPFQG